jgi:hypothetical protein
VGQVHVVIAVSAKSTDVLLDGIRRIHISIESMADDTSLD